MLIATGTLLLAGCGARSDSQVASDLATLIGTKSLERVLIRPSRIACSHQSGNSYSCGFQWRGQQFVVAVTDDGHAISEQGFSPQIAAALGGG